MKHSEQPIGVMDSGLGGMSVLQALQTLMPEEHYLYFGDQAYAPYGEKSLETVRERTLAIARIFLEQGAKAMVVACNTATSAAITLLRETYPDLPIIGMEPALKPAVTAHPGGRILVMATPLTIKEQKFQHLLSAYEKDADILPVPCPGLAECIEHGHFSDAALSELLHTLLCPMLDKPVDAVVLGCTHYPFVKENITALVGENVPLYDGGMGAAREVKRRLEQAGCKAPGDQKGSVIFQSSGDAACLTDIAKKLHVI